MNHMNKEWLYHEYIELGKSTLNIGKEVGKDSSTIKYWLNKFDIPIRPNCSKTIHTLLQNRTTVVCEYCGKEFLKTFARAKRRNKHFCSEECVQHYNQGERHPSYKGLTTTQGDRRKYSYALWRKMVKERDENTCQRCGSHEDLHVHHLLPYSEYEDLRTEIDNGITLCSKCHYEVHREMKIWSKR